MKVTCVSVIIPCYNRAHIIGAVIEALLSQSRLPEEIIVVDDASTDNSVEVLNSFPITVIQHPENRGPATARNNGFAKSSGDVVIFIDSDAIPDFRMVEALLDVYENYSNLEQLGGVGGKGVETCTEGNINQWRCIHGRQDHGDKPKDSVDYLFGLCCSFPRKIFGEIGGFDVSFPINSGEDLDIGFRISKAGYRLAYTPFAIVNHYHCDTYESLLRVQYNWNYWNLVSRKRNRMPTTRTYLSVIRFLFLDTFNDLVIFHNPGLVKISAAVFIKKISALIKASLYKPF